MIKYFHDKSIFIFKLVQNIDQTLFVNIHEASNIISLIINEKSCI